MLGLLLRRFGVLFFDRAVHAGSPWYSGFQLATGLGANGRAVGGFTHCLYSLVGGSLLDGNALSGRGSLHRLRN